MLNASNPTCHYVIIRVKQLNAYLAGVTTMMFPNKVGENLSCQKGAFVHHLDYYLPYEIFNKSTMKMRIVRKKITVALNVTIFFLLET